MEEGQKNTNTLKSDATSGSLQHVEDEPYVLYNSDHPGMAMMTSHLSRSNYLT